MFYMATLLHDCLPPPEPEPQHVHVSTGRGVGGTLRKGFNNFRIFFIEISNTKQFLFLQENYLFKAIFYNIQ